MPENQFDEQVLSIFRKDARYSPDAYHFVAQALHFTQEQFANPQPSGRELLEGIRLHALQLFGPATFRTFRSWGIQGCQHFADIVQNLVAEGCIEPLTGGFMRTGISWPESWPATTCSSRRCTRPLSSSITSDQSGEPHRSWAFRWSIFST